MIETTIHPLKLEKGSNLILANILNNYLADDNLDDTEKELLEDIIIQLKTDNKKLIERYENEILPPLDLEDLKTPSDKEISRIETVKSEMINEISKLSSAYYDIRTTIASKARILKDLAGKVNKKHIELTNIVEDLHIKYGDYFDSLISVYIETNSDEINSSLVKQYSEWLENLNNIENNYIDFSALNWEDCNVPEFQKFLDEFLECLNELQLKPEFEED